MLTDSPGGELTAATITVRDAQTGEVLASGSILGGATVDLSHIDAGAHPSLIIDGSTSAANATVPWDDGIPPRLVVRWSGDPKPICFSTTAASCTGGANGPLSAFARVATPAREVEGQLTRLGTLCTPVPPAPVAAVAKAKAKGPCTGRRKFNINVFYPGRKIRRIVVVANGTRQRVLRRNPRPRAVIDLTRKRKQEVMVLIRITTKKGKVVTSRRYYNPCTLKMKGRGFRF